MLSHYGPDRARDTFFAGKLDSPAPPGPYPDLRAPGILGVWRSSRPAQLPLSGLAPISPLLAATRQPSSNLAAPSRTTTRNRTTRTGSPGPGRSRWLGTLCASPRAASNERSLPGRRGQRETVRMRAIPPAPGKALGQRLSGSLVRHIYPRSYLRRKSTLTLSFKSPLFSLVPRKKKKQIHPEMIDEASLPLGQKDLGSNANSNLLCILGTSAFSDPWFSHLYNSSNFRVLM